MNSDVRKIATDTAIPLVLAGLSGILTALPALCPYKPGGQSKKSDTPPLAPSVLQPIAEANLD